MSTHKLYKFRSVNINNLTALANNKFWFSSISDFNDPFEGTYIFDEDLTQEDLILLQKAIKRNPSKNVDAEKYTKLLAELGLDPENHRDEELYYALVKDKFKSLIKIIHDTKCISMSQNDEQKDTLCEKLLWSHYADGLRGFCLVFDKDALQSNFYHSDKPTIRSIKVAYQNHPNKLKLSEFIRSKSFYDQLDHDYIQQVTTTIATKSSDWLYENEIRFISFGEDNLHSYNPETLIEIVVGDKMPTSEHNLVVDTAKSVNPHITVKKACLKLNSYNIQITDY